MKSPQRCKSKSVRIDSEMPLAFRIQLASSITLGLYFVQILA